MNEPDMTKKTHTATALRLAALVTTLSLNACAGLPTARIELPDSLAFVAPATANMDSVEARNQVAAADSSTERFSVPVRDLLANLQKGDGPAIEGVLAEHWKVSPESKERVKKVAAALRAAAEKGAGFSVDQVLRSDPSGVAFILKTIKPVTDSAGVSRVRNTYLEIALHSAAAEGAGAPTIVDVGYAAVAKVDTGSLWPKETPKTDAQVRAVFKSNLDYLSRNDAFSGVVLVQKNGKDFFSYATGMADKNHGVPIRPNTKFHVASAGKMFTAIAIAKLVEQGQIGYHDTLERVWPEYPNKDVAARVTIHQLLNHTSGLGEALKPETRAANGNSFETITDYVKVFKDDPLAFEPGTRWQYSNAGYFVLGGIIERVSGVSYPQFIKANVFEPAGMRDSGFDDYFSRVPNYAVGYGRDPEDLLGTQDRRSNWTLIRSKGGPAGGGYSTAADMARFMEALFAGKLIDAKRVGAATAGNFDMWPGTKYGYGFWDSEKSDRAVRGHAGGGPGYGINVDVNHMAAAKVGGDRYSVVVLSNYDPPVAQDFAQDVVKFLAPR
jgi:CubicO group peptidase (beta-lactamase class C family)